MPGPFTQKNPVSLNTSTTVTGCIKPRNLDAETGFLAPRA